MSRELVQLIGGQEVGGEGERIVIRNPAALAQEIASGREATTSQTTAAIAAAHDAAFDWSRTSPSYRAALLEAVADRMDGMKDDVAGRIVDEVGKPLRDALAEVDRCIDVLRFYAQIGLVQFGRTYPQVRKGQLTMSLVEPLGVVGAITPWNFPLSIPSQKIGPALAAGNTVVLKPSSSAPLIAVYLARIFVDAGLPPGVLNVVVGTGAATGGVLAEDPRVAGLTFTGSTEVGRRLGTQLAARLARFQGELGGKNVLYVAGDGDIVHAASIASKGVFGLAGQSCTATGLILVESSAYEAFLGRLCDEADRLTVGDGRDSPDMGPLISPKAVEGAERAVETAIDRGDAVLAYARSAESLPDGGCFVGPTVLRDVALGSDVAQMELFSPIACVAPVDSHDSALEVINSLSAGLATSICTTSFAVAHRFVQEVEVGIVKVNGTTSGLDINVPFGGFKDSSSGSNKELGFEGLDFYSRIKSAYLAYS